MKPFSWRNNALQRFKNKNISEKWSFFYLKIMENILSFLMQHQSFLNYWETVPVDHGGLQAIKIFSKICVQKRFSPHPLPKIYRKFYYKNLLIIRNIWNLFSQSFLCQHISVKLKGWLDLTYLASVPVQMEGTSTTVLV